MSLRGERFVESRILLSSSAMCYTSHWLARWPSTSLQRSINIHTYYSHASNTLLTFDLMFEFHSPSCYRPGRLRILKQFTGVLSKLWLCSTRKSWFRVKVQSLEVVNGNERWNWKLQLHSGSPLRLFAQAVPSVDSIESIQVVHVSEETTRSSSSFWRFEVLSSVPYLSGRVILAFCETEGSTMTILGHVP